MAPNKKHVALIKDFKTDKVKNANVIVDFLKLIESNDLKDLKSGIHGLQFVFCHLLRERDIKAFSELPDDLMTAAQKFSRWLYDRYNEAQEKLLDLLRHEAVIVRELSLSSIIKLMKVEGQYPVKKLEGGSIFPSSRLQALLDILISSEFDHQKDIKNLKEALECQDFMLFTLMCLSGIVKNRKKETVTEKFASNLVLILEQINIPEVPDPKKDSISCTNPFLGKPNKNKSKSGAEMPMLPYISYPKTKRAYNVIWMQVITYPLTSNLYRRCLILIPEKVMQHLEKPMRLTGFFMDAYDLGGAISLLALQGVFILVNKYNLDYPNFYQKLYGLLEPTVFHAKYRPRFFMLMDRFMASSHIPEYIVAAFIKRLARLSLVAPASCLVLILKFIANLLIRFPGLQTLVHNPNATAFEDDPYDPDEPDLFKCNACKSSLWEIASLQQHVVPSISKATGFLDKTLPAIEYDISQVVETTYEEVHEKCCKLAVHETVATTFHKPMGLFVHQDDKMSMAWSVI